MRILLATGLYPPEIGGPATYAKLFEERLPRYGIEVSVLPFSTVRDLPPVLRHTTYLWKLLRIAPRADVILAQDTISTGLPAALAALLLRKWFVVRVPGDYAWEQGVQRFGVDDSLDDFQGRSYGVAVALFRMLQRFVIHRADRVIAPSNYLGNIIARWTRDKKRIDIIYNGIEVPSGTTAPSRQSDLIISSGRLVPWKGFIELIDVVAAHKEWRLDILGDGPQRVELIDRMWEMHAEKRVTLRGSVSHRDALRAFAEASAFVLNSRYEGLSHTLLEAMSVGTPVIATRVGGNPEVVDDGVNGLLIEGNNEKGLEEALARLLSDATLRKKLGEAAREKAKEFSIDKTVETTARLIKSLV